MSLVEKIKVIHFQGGQNLTQGGKTAKGASLAELIRNLEGEGQVLQLESAASAGGGATEDDVVVAGLLATDEILSVSQRVEGGNSLALIGWSDQQDGSLDLTWTGDPGAGAIVRVAIKRKPLS